MTKFTVPPASRVQAPKRPTPKKKPAFPGMREAASPAKAKAEAMYRRPARRGR